MRPHIQRHFTKMSKIALGLFLIGCIFFGLINLVISDKGSAPQDAELSERMSTREKGVPSPVYSQRPNNLNLPSQSPSQNLLVECYSCTDCSRILPNTTTKLCPMSLNPANRGCVAYSEQYKHMRKPWYIRGCASERGTCAEIIKAHADQSNVVSLLSCFECDGDKCNSNSASQSASDFSIAFLALVITPLIGKLTFS